MPGNKIHNSTLRKMGNLGEQMAQNERNEEAAKEMYMNGITDPHEIASRLGCPVQHVHNWIKWGNWDGDENPIDDDESRSKSNSTGCVVVVVVLVIAYFIYKIFISKTIG